ncbi:hypothetical protein ACFQ0B_00760 [Nonomuraea thailandensis]
MIEVPLPEVVHNLGMVRSIDLGEYWESVRVPPSADRPAGTQPLGSSRTAPARRSKISPGSLNCGFFMKMT